MANHRKIINALLLVSFVATSCAPKYSTHKEKVEYKEEITDVNTKIVNLNSSKPQLVIGTEIRKKIEEKNKIVKEKTCFDFGEGLYIAGCAYSMWGTYLVLFTSLVEVGALIIISGLTPLLHEIFCREKVVSSTIVTDTLTTLVQPGQLNYILYINRKYATKTNQTTLSINPIKYINLNTIQQDNKNIPLELTFVFPDYNYQKTDTIVLPASYIQDLKVGRIASENRLKHLKDALSSKDYKSAENYLEEVYNFRSWLTTEDLKELYMVLPKVVNQNSVTNLLENSGLSFEESNILIEHLSNMNTNCIKEYVTAYSHGLISESEAVKFYKSLNIVEKFYVVFKGISTKGNTNFPSNPCAIKTIPNNKIQKIADNIDDVLKPINAKYLTQIESTVFGEI